MIYYWNVSSVQSLRVNQLRGSSYPSNYDSGRYGVANAPPPHPKAETGSRLPGSPKMLCHKYRNLFCRVLLGFDAFCLDFG